MAKEIKTKGIDTKDAIHIACAKYSKTDYFITTDKNLLKKEIEGIEIGNPLDYIKMNDTVLVNEGTKILTQTLGKVNAERFITLIIKEPFDYTRWRKDLYKDMNVDELSKKAMDFVNSKK